MPARVGFVGLGAMGKGMASSLAKKGFPLQVFDVRPEAAADLEALGAVRADTPRACAEGCDVLVLAVLNQHQVNSVLFEGEGSALGGGFTGVCVVCATVPPTFAEETARRAEGLGASYMDAPMSGGTVRAGSGDLSFMVSGSEPALEKSRPVLEGMGKTFVLGASPGLGSSMKLVNQMLAGSHIVLAAEAMAMAAKAGLNTRQVFEIITSAAGNSFMFENRVPHMLEPSPTVHSAVDIWPKDLTIVMDEARRLAFPCPITSQALQQYIAARGLGLGSQDDSRVVQVYTAFGGEAVAAPPVSEEVSAVAAGGAKPRVGFVGLGAMGRGMATSLANAGFPLQVFDVRPEAAADLEALGAVRKDTPRACAEGCDVLVLAVLNQQQVSSVLFDGEGSALGEGSSFSGACIVCATVPPPYAEEAARRAEAAGAQYVDAPMSGGTVRAAGGDLTFMVSAAAPALERARPVLDGMGKTFVLGFTPGLGASMKLVNQMLAGSHIVLAAEAMAMAAKEGLNTQQVFEIIRSAAGNSFMFENRVPHMLSGDATVHSAVDIWPKDLNIVLDESKRLGMPCPMTAAALQQFYAAKGLGLGSQDDSTVVKVYETFTGVAVASAKA